MSARRRISVPRGSRTPVLADTLASLTSVFGMGTGVTSPLWPPQRRPTESNRRSVQRRSNRIEPKPYRPNRIGLVGSDRVSIVCACNPVCAWTRFVESQCGPTLITSMARSVSARGLNDSLPRRVHPESIELVFYE